MTKKHILFISLFFIYALICFYIAYEGQFISNYLESRGFLQEEYEYPVSGVLFCCGLYLLVILNYVPLFLLKFSKKHRYLSFTIFSIIPILITFLAFLGAMHASSYWGAFILVMMLTFLAHFLVLPFIIKCYRNT